MTVHNMGPLVYFGYDLNSSSRSLKSLNQRCNYRVHLVEDTWVILRSLRLSQVSKKDLALDNYYKMILPQL